MLYGRTGERRFALVNVYAGGMGARSDRDGLSATGFPSGVRCTPVEIIESGSPVVVWRKELRQDSGGAGRYRGGLGQTMEFGHVAEEPFSLSAMFERVDNPAAGRNGGMPGAPGRAYTSTGRQLNSKGSQLIAAGESLMLEIPGGGGFGRAYDREEALVALDVREGRVSREAAAREYGVVVLETGGVDQTATRRARLTRA
jgi:N-methylhydantoinase B